MQEGGVRRVLDVGDKALLAAVEPDEVAGLAVNGGVVAPGEVTGRALDPYFEATVDAAEEAVIASMINAETTTGYQGRTLHALPLDEVRSHL